MVKAKVGMRVHVFSADGQGAELGMGTIEKVEPLYLGDTDELISNTYPSKIKLDSGEETEGCKCWWVSDRQHKLALTQLRKEQVN